MTKSYTKIDSAIDIWIGSGQWLRMLAGVNSQMGTGLLKWNRKLGKLARTLCPKCKRKRPTTNYEREIFKRILGKDVDSVYEPVGCDDCNRGFRGRIALHEVLFLTDYLDEFTIRSIMKYNDHEFVNDLDEKTNSD